MRRPFKLTIEEALEGESEVITSEPLTETELEQNAEETAELNAEIEQDSGEISETLEEVDALEEQAAATDEVLAATADEETGGEGGEPVADEASAITEEQVVNAEESFKWSLARLGGATKYEAVVTLAKEHKASGLSRRARLKVCNEGVKETIARLIQSVINFAKMVASRVVIFVKQNLAKFSNYKKQISENGKIISKLEPSSIDAEDFTKMLAGSPSVEMATVIDESSVAGLVSITAKKEEQMKKAEPLIKKLIASAAVINNKDAEDDKKLIEDSFKAVADKDADNIVKNGAKYGISVTGAKSLTGEVLNATGKVALCLNSDGKVEKISLDFASDFGENKKVDISKLIASFNGNDSKMGNASAKLKNIADLAVKVQKEVSDGLKKFEAGAKIEGFGKAKAIHAIKGAGVDLSMALFNTYLASIKTYVRVGSALAAAGTKKEKEKKEKAK